MIHEAIELFRQPTKMVPESTHTFGGRVSPKTALNTKFEKPCIFMQAQLNNSKMICQRKEIGCHFVSSTYMTYDVQSFIHNIIHVICTNDYLHCVWNRVYRIGFHINEHIYIYIYIKNNNTPF